MSKITCANEMKTTYNFQEQDMKLCGQDKCKQDSSYEQHTDLWD